jgi:chemotaxis protein MotA
MSSNGIGFISAILMLVIMAFWTGHGDAGQFADLHGFFAVCAGTTAITIISTPFADVKMFFPMIKTVSKKFPEDAVEITNHLVEMAGKARVDMDSLAAYKGTLKDPFLADAVTLLVDGFETSAINKILRRRLEVQKERENGHAKMFKNLGKYPPACGLMGTVFGMIALLGSLGQEGAAEKIGPSMSVALAATLYGVILANMVILPVADNLMFRTQKSIAKRELIIEGILLIKQKTTPVMVREILLSHLSPTQRNLVKGGKGGDGAAKAA